MPGRYWPTSRPGGGAPDVLVSKPRLRGRSRFWRIRRGVCARRARAGPLRKETRKRERGRRLTTGKPSPAGPRRPGRYPQPGPGNEERGVACRASRCGYASCPDCAVLWCGYASCPGRAVSSGKTVPGRRRGGGRRHEGRAAPRLFPTVPRAPRRRRRRLLPWRENSKACPWAWGDAVCSPAGARPLCGCAALARRATAPGTSAG